MLYALLYTAKAVISDPVLRSDQSQDQDQDQDQRPDRGQNQEQKTGYICYTQLAAARIHAQDQTSPHNLTR